MSAEGKPVLLQRPSPAVSLPVCLAVLAAWASLHLLTFHQIVLPLTYVLPLLLCIWHRDRRLLWGMVALLSIAAYAELFWTLPADSSMATHRGLALAGRLVNVIAAGIVLDAAVRALAALSEHNARAQASNHELEATNEELAAREEEISRQNEELQSQTEELAQQNEEIRSQAEELEQQNEELNSQAEELQTISEELARRESMLHTLLNATRALDAEEHVLREVCEHGLALLGEEVVAAAVVKPSGDQLVVEAHVSAGSEPFWQTQWPLKNSLANIVMQQNKTGCLEDASLRPDVIFPGRRAQAFQSALATPLRIMDHTIGAVEFYCEQPHVWTQDEFRLTEWLAAQCSVGMETIHLRHEIERSERRYRCFVEASTQVVWITNARGEVEQPIPAWQDITGQSFEQTRGLGWLQAVHPDDRPQVDEAWRQARETPGIYEVDYRLCTQDGTWRNIRARGVPVVEKDGTIREFIGTCIDLTEQQRAEAALRESERRFRTLADAIPQLAWIARADGWIEWYNQRWYQYTGTTPEQMAGWGWQSVHDPKTLPDVMGRWQSSIASGEPFDMVFPLRGADGVFRSFLTRIMPLKDHQGRVMQWFGTNTDVSAQSELDAQRQILLDAERAARSEFERVVRLKDEFLATVSHELRSPLNAIVGWTRLLASGKTDAAKAVDIISRSARTLTQLVEDLLDMSKIISGKIRLTREPTDLIQLVINVVDAIQFTAEAKRVHVDLSFTPDLQPLECDPTRVQQIINNLLTNAVKFTPEGGRVTMAVTQESNSVIITIKDTGKGIAPEFLSQLFQRFRQEDGSIARRHGGLGLGLSITRHLVELHGGTIQAESEGEGKGATFTVILPRVGAFSDDEDSQHLSPTYMRPQAVPFDDCTLSGIRVLSVDDDAYSRELIERVLSDAGAQVRVCSSTIEATHALSEFKPHVLVSDIGMPEEDGFRFMRQLRAAGDWTASLPSIALTGLSRPEDREQAMACGFDRHLGKPFDPGTLCLQIRELMHARSQGDGKSKPPTSECLD